MGLGEGVETMKEFLTHNNISFSDGRVKEDFNVSYFIGNKLKFEEEIEVLFDFIHTDFTRNISLLDNDIDSEKYYTEFTSKYQDYDFDKPNNHFIINSNGPNKHGKPYKIIITTI